MSDETLLTAARRVVRFILIDDHQHGGLVSRETIQAARILDHQVRTVEATEKQTGTRFKQAYEPAEAVK